MPRLGIQKTSWKEECMLEFWEAASFLLLARTGPWLQRPAFSSSSDTHWMSCHLTFCNLCFSVRVLPQSCCSSAYQPLRGCLCHTLLRWMLLLPTSLPRAEILMLLFTFPQCPSPINHSPPVTWIFPDLFMHSLHPPWIQCIRLASVLCCLDYCTSLLRLFAVFAPLLVIGSTSHQQIELSQMQLQSCHSPACNSSLGFH